MTGACKCHHLTFVCLEHAEGEISTSHIYSTLAFWGRDHQIICHSNPPLDPSTSTHMGFSHRYSFSGFEVRAILWAEATFHCSLGWCRPLLSSCDCKPTVISLGVMSIQVLSPTSVRSLFPLPPSTQTVFMFMCMGVMQASDANDAVMDLLPILKPFFLTTRGNPHFFFTTKELSETSVFLNSTLIF